MTLRQVFIRNLKRIRQELGLSQMHLSTFCNMSSSYIGEIEAGRKFPSIEMIEKIAKTLQVQPHLLFLDRQNTQTAAYLIPDIVKKNILQRSTAALQKIINKY